MPLAESGRAARILLVEDNHGDARLVRKALGVWPGPVDLRVASNSEEALRLLGREFLPDIAILDLNLPGPDGRELLRAIRADPSLCHLPALILTGSTREADVLSCYQSGASAYLHKPHDYEGYEQLMRGIHAFWITLAKLPRRD